ncbi:hypothetical protein ACCS64_37980, partial [Rhizobium ruizarguesonis]
RADADGEDAFFDELEFLDFGNALLVLFHPQPFRLLEAEIGFAREVADSVVFMDSGRILEAGPPARILTQAEHPRTREFLAKVI